MNHMDQEPLRAPVPADVGRPDRIFAGFTLRQTAILGGAALTLYGAWAATAGKVPTLVFLAAAIPVLAVAVFVALGRRDGLPLDVWLLHACRHRRSPRHLTPVHGDRPAAAPPAWAPGADQLQPAPAPLRMPAQGITADGLVDLGGDGAVALVEASTVNFGLRSPGEQNALVAGFARWLHSLDAPTQILVRAHHVDLTGLAHSVAEGAPTLPDPALEQAAISHAGFLAQLGATHELLARQITLAVRDARSPIHAARRAAEAAHSLAACEVAAQACDAPTTASVLNSAVRPDAAAPPAGLAPPGAVITTPRGDRR